MRVARERCSQTSAAFPRKSTTYSGLKRTVFSLLAVATLAAQGLDPAALLKPPTDTWPTYNGDYSGRRYSPLAHINTSNVGSLTLAWAFQTHSVALKSTPLLVNGILYFTVPD